MMPMVGKLLSRGGVEAVDNASQMLDLLLAKPEKLAQARELLGQLHGARTAADQRLARERAAFDAYRLQQQAALDAREARLAEGERTLAARLERMRAEMAS